jgi:hypothetical protein
MRMRFVVLAGVATVIASVVIKEGAADQHRPLPRWDVRNSTEATGPEISPACECSDTPESSVATRSPAPSTGAAGDFGSNLKLRQETADAEARRYGSDTERRRFAGELDDIKRQLPGAQQAQVQKDAEIARLKEQLGRTPAFVPREIRMPVRPSARGGFGSGRASAPRRARPARWMGRFFARPFIEDCFPDGPLYDYGPYESMHDRARYERIPF